MMWSGVRRTVHRLVGLRSLASVTSAPHVAIIGSGPAGFYTAQQILKGHPSARVDIFERLPVPYGLVRFGVAPDHPEVKNVISTFEQTAGKDRCSFVGNVTVGRDVKVAELRAAYSAVVLAYGAEEDKKFNIPGEDLAGVYSARSFVGWYNGLPEESQLKPNLDTETCVVLGQGNVAIDVCRILITPLDILQKTDITEDALEILSKSRIKRVILVGRRGPLQAAFTTAEFREMTRLPQTKPILLPDDFTELSQHFKDLPRPRRRLTELMVKTATAPADDDVQRWSEAEKSWQLKFLRSPVEFTPGSDQSALSGVNLSVNSLQGDLLSPVAVPTEQTEHVECGMVLRSIGYRSLPLEDDAPFDPTLSIVPNSKGRVSGQSGLYCSGWAKRGPVGVIVSTMTDAFETGKVIVEDLKSGSINSDADTSARDSLLTSLEDKGIKTVNFSDWEKIDAVEKSKGEELNKPREKFTSVEDMMSVLK